MRPRCFHFEVGIVLDARPPYSSQRAKMDIRGGPFLCSQDSALLASFSVNSKSPPVELLASILSSLDFSAFGCHSPQTPRGFHREDGEFVLIKVDLVQQVVAG